MKGHREPLKQFTKRKLDHLRFASQASSQSDASAGFESVELIHEALPTGSLEAIQLGCNSLGSKDRKPFFVSSMTAGHLKSGPINRIFAEAAHEMGWRMGVGSQRRELFDPKAVAEWSLLRKKVPNIVLMANLGISQLVDCKLEDIRRLVEGIGALALIVHLNPLQECLQEEGTPDFSKSEDSLAKVCAELGVPVIVKETGCGMSSTTMMRLIQCGVSVIDVAGRGGTHWGRVEGARSSKDSPFRRAAHVFRDWGISTVDSLLEAQPLLGKVELWASGGVRSGLDAAKCFALGAHQVGLAHPLLIAASEGVSGVIKAMEQFEFELKVAIFCSGGSRVQDLREKGRWRLTKEK